MSTVNWLLQTYIGFETEDQVKNRWTKYGLEANCMYSVDTGEQAHTQWPTALGKNSYATSLQQVLKLGL